MPTKGPVRCFGPPGSAERSLNQCRKSYRNRPRHHELLRCHHGRQGCSGDRELRGRAYHAQHGRLHRQRRAAGRPVRQAAGGDQPVQHPLCHQAPDRPPLRRPDGRQGQGPGALHHRARRQRRRLGGSAQREVFAQPDQRLHPRQDEGDRRGLSRRAGRSGGHHRPGLLQRQPAPGDQGCRPHRRPRRAAHHQRADRGGARLWHGQEGQRHDRGLRPWWRHVRHLRAGDRRRRVRGEVHQWRHLPRRRGFRRAGDRLPGRRVPQGAGDRPAARQAGAAAAEGSGGEGEDRAVVFQGDRDQPALHHRGRIRAQAPGDEADPGEAGIAGR